MKRAPLILLFIGLLPSASGCGAMARDVTREATPGAIEGVAEGLSDETTQEKLVNAIDKTRVQTATRKVGSGVADGVLDTLEDPARQERMGALVDAFMERGMESMTAPERTAALERMIARVIGSSVASAIDVSMSRLLSDDNQDKMRRVTRNLVGDVIRTSIDTVSESLPKPEERNKAVGALTHEIAKEATLGFQAAIDQARDERDRKGVEGSDGSLLVAAGDAAQKGSSVMTAIVIGLAMLTLGLGALLAWALKRTRQRSAELSQRDDALLLLMESIKASEGKPWAGDLREAIKAAARDRDGGDYLRRVLRDRKDLRFGTTNDLEGRPAAASQPPPGNGTSLRNGSHRISHA